MHVEYLHVIIYLITILQYNIFLKYISPCVCTIIMNSRMLVRIQKLGAHNWQLEILGCLIFEGRPQLLHISTINMYLYLLIKIMHNTLIQGNGNYIEMEKLQLYVWNWNFNKLLILEGLGVQKTPSWLRLWWIVCPAHLCDMFSVRLLLYIVQLLLFCIVAASDPVYGCFVLWCICETVVLYCSCKWSSVWM